MTTFTLLVLFACGSTPDAGHGHAHGAGGDHAPHEDEGESVAVTRWTESHELFVEFDAPAAGQPFSYHAHVTRLEDNHAADSGTLTFRFEQDGFVVETVSDDAVARSGIFARQATAPAEGTYDLVLVYEDGAERVEWPAGQVIVAAGQGVAHPEETQGEVTFLKESQWQIPFHVLPAGERPLAPTLTASAMVHPAPGDTTVVAAPMDGLLVWVDGLPVVGREVTRGERLATLVPGGAAEHWSALVADVASAKAAVGLAEADVSRTEGLVERDLLSSRRLEEARAELQRTQAELRAAQARLAALSSSSSGAVPIRAPRDGLVVEVGSSHGSSVGAGAPLVSVSSGSALMLEGWVHDRAFHELAPVASLAVHRGDWAGPVDLQQHGGRLLTEQLVFDASSLSAPVTVLLEDDAGLVPGDLVELQIGVGGEQPRLAVPRSAVVEVNGQDVVFVQETGESFSRRRVELGAADATHIEVLSGLEVGEMVVADGGFDVHVASLSGALESHRH
jgi:cobalt-zinc-cadmium efflux system membrane fusion protein